MQCSLGSRNNLCPRLLTAAINLLNVGRDLCHSRYRIGSQKNSVLGKQSADLSPRARERWESEKPVQCPGIAAGQFEATGMKSYAVLLVPEHNPDAGYKFMVFSPKAGALTSFEMKALEQWDGGGAANFFIRAVKIRSSLTNRREENSTCKQLMAFRFLIPQRTNTKLTCTFGQTAGISTSP